MSWVQSEAGNKSLVISKQEGDKEMKKLILTLVLVLNISVGFGFDVNSPPDWVDVNSIVPEYRLYYFQELCEGKTFQAQWSKIATRQEGDMPVNIFFDNIVEGLVTDSDAGLMTYTPIEPSVVYLYMTIKPVDLDTCVNPTEWKLCCVYKTNQSVILTPPEPVPFVEASVSN